MGGGQIVREGVAETAQRDGGNRGRARQMGQGGGVSGDKGGGIYILMKFSTKQLEH